MGEVPTSIVARSIQVLLCMTVVAGTCLLLVPSEAGRPISRFEQERLIGSRRQVGLCVLTNGMSAVNSGCQTVGAMPCPSPHCSSSTCWTACANGSNMWRDLGGGGGVPVSVVAVTTCNALGWTRNQHYCPASCDCRHGPLRAANVACVIAIPHAGTNTVYRGCDS